MQHPAPRVAASGLIRLFNRTIPGNLLKALVYKVAKDRRCVLSNGTEYQLKERNTIGETTTFFLTILQELLDWKSAVFGPQLEMDLELQLGQRRDLHDALNDMQNQIAAGTWFDVLPLLATEDVTYINNTKAKPGKDPDRHCFQPAKGKKNYKCIWCKSYNGGVGLGEQDRCNKCGEIQIRYPGFGAALKSFLERQGSEDATQTPAGEWVMWKPSRRRGAVNAGGTKPDPMEKESRKDMSNCPSDPMELNELFQQIYGRGGGDSDSLSGRCSGRCSVSCQVV